MINLPGFKVEYANLWCYNKFTFQSVMCIDNYKYGIIRTDFLKTVNAVLLTYISMFFLSYFYTKSYPLTFQPDLTENS